MAPEKQAHYLTAGRLQRGREAVMDARHSKSGIQTEGEVRFDMEKKNREPELQEEWIKLKQYGIPEGEFIVTQLIQDGDGTKIVLDDEKDSVEIFFDGIPVLVRNTVEGMRMRTWGAVQSKYADQSFFRGAVLFEVENSRLVQWCAEESCGFYEADELKHYCIVTGEELVDVVATFEPTVKIEPLRVSL